MDPLLSRNQDDKMSKNNNSNSADKNRRELAKSFAQYDAQNDYFDRHFEYIEGRGRRNSDPAVV